MTSSIAAGYGWGIVHIFLYYMQYVAKSIGPGTYFDRTSCSLFSVITKASLMSHCLFCEHVFLMLIFYYAISTKSNWTWWFAVACHLFSSLWNIMQVPCLVQIIGQFLLSILFGFVAWKLIHRPK